MDRLHALSLALLLLLGCEKDGGGGEPAPSTGSRVNAVAAQPKEPTLPEEFCDVLGGERRFAWPPLAGDAPEEAEGWRWVNVWATWCKPCVEEVPLLRAWREKLAAAGAEVELLFLSADESAEHVESFQKEQEEAPEGPRIEDPGEALEAWKPSVGLDSGAPIPIHVFVDPDGTVQCARSGSVSESDYSAVAELVGAGAD